MEKSIITDKYFEVYVYGFELILSFISTTAIILTIGILSRQFMSSLVFISVFVFLRRFTGGYHAETQFKCKICTTGLCVANMILAIYLSLDQFCYISICIVGFIFVVVFSPVENKYKPIPLPRRPKIKIISAIIYLTISILGMVIHIKFETLSNAVLGSLVSVVALMFIAKIKERRAVAHEDDYGIDG